MTGTIVPEMAVASGFYEVQVSSFKPQVILNCTAHEYFRERPPQRPVGNGNHEGVCD